MQILNRFKRRFLDRIGNSNQSGNFTIDGEKHHRLAILPQGLRTLARNTRIDLQFIQQRMDFPAARGPTQRFP